MTKPTTPRSHPRLPKRFKVTSGHTTLFTLDVGPGGLAFEAMKPPARGSTVSGTVNIGGVDFAFEGLVAWSRPSDSRVGQRGRCGVRFTRVADGLFAALNTSRGQQQQVAVNAPRLVAATPPTASHPATDSMPTISLHGETWVVRSPASEGRRSQEYRCAQESQARNLYRALCG